MELEDEDIDVDLHSRQILVYGHKAMKLLSASNVLVVGMQGLGAEIAKNLILTGVKSVTLHDERTVELWDLSGSFVLSENDVGKSRSEASVRKLQELNKRVRVTTLSGILTKEKLSDFQAVVFTASDLNTAMEFNDYCHHHQPPIHFIKADVNGLFGSVFCDFGPEFTVVDVDGEEPHTGIIADITVDNNHVVVVHCVSDEKLQFQDGDFVIFSEIHGMEELNDRKPRKIEICTPYSFFIEDEDTTEFGKYEKGGIVTQVKQPKVLNFRPLREVLDDPTEFLCIDASKPDHLPVLHLAFKALDKFISQMGRFPTAGSEDDAHKLISIAETINNQSPVSECKLHDIKPELLIDFSHGARAVLSPMATLFGGIAAQEVIKACSRMFHPIFQLFYFDSIESLSMEKLKPKHRGVLNRRYDAQISVFGRKLQERLQETQPFLVGCGSLGCELLKNLALMGVSCCTDQDSRRLTVADNKIIKKHNLSTGLLFHKNRIGMSKAVVAADAAASINPEFYVTPLVKHVGPKTQNVFDIGFWKNLHLAISSVDDVDSRMYVDRRCLQFQMPHLVSATMGAKCSTHMVIPKLTETYGVSMDPLAIDVAGRIIPKIATCASVAAGLVCLELYKVADDNHYTHEAFRNTYANLALPFSCMAQPLRRKVYNEHHQNTRLRWTTWDYWYMQNKPTLGELLACLEAEKGVHVYQLSYEGCIVYDTTLPNHEYLKTQDVIDVMMENAKDVFHPVDLILVVTIACLDDDQNPVDVPPLYIDIRFSTVIRE